MIACTWISICGIFISIVLISANPSYSYRLVDDESDLANNSPIIGLLSQEISYHLNTRFPDQYHSFIAASYVKFLEGSGARVVPIWIGKDREYYEDILSKLNGVLFPGGATWFNQSDGYADAGRYIYEIAADFNDKGSYFPIWGTCLGFELLTYISADGVEHRAHCSSDRQSLPLDFKPTMRQSRLFGTAPDEYITILSTEHVTSNFHQFCVTEQNLTDYNIADQWNVLSTNNDWNGMNFISSFEHTKYPFYGVQFHPEKNLYEWIQNRNISHTSNSIKVSQYFGNFFIDECRKNKHQFANVSEERRHLIYNYETTYTALVGSAYEQCYLFVDSIDYRADTSGIGTFKSSMIFIAWIFFLQTVINSL